MISEPKVNHQKETGLYYSSIFLTDIRSFFFHSATLCGLKFNIPYHMTNTHIGYLKQSIFPKLQRNPCIKQINRNREHLKIKTIRSVFGKFLLMQVMRQAHNTTYAYRTFGTFNSRDISRKPEENCCAILLHNENEIEIYALRENNNKKKTHSPLESRKERICTLTYTKANNNKKNNYLSKLNKSNSL